MSRRVPAVVIAARDRHRSGRRSQNRLSPLARDIVVILVVKAVVLGVLWFAFFRSPPAHDMTMDPLDVEHRLLAPATESPNAHR